jgi:16S rRNA (guanine527-N7)-methyltransferase
VSATQIEHATDFARKFSVSRETLARLEAFVDLLRNWQARINLVAGPTLNDVWSRHIADSAQLVPLAVGLNALPKPFHWVDLGPGGGFPGLVVAALLADDASKAGKVTLIDGDSRKCAFLREGARLLVPAGAGVTVDIHNTRIETQANRTKLGPIDVVSARAVAPLPRLIDLTAPLFGGSTVGLFLKGREAGTEIELARAAGKWFFDVNMVESATHPEARILIVRNVDRQAASNDRPGA